MDLLAKVGIVVAIPLVVQFIKDDFDKNHALAIAVGAALAVLLALYTNAIPETAIGWVWVVCNGGIAGAMATAGVSVGFEVANKIGGTGPETAKVADVPNPGGDQ